MTILNPNINIKTITLSMNRHYIVISDDVFIHISEIPTVVYNNIDFYRDYFISLFTRESEILLDLLHYDNTPTPTPHTYYLVNFIDESIVWRIERIEKITISRRLYK